MIKQYPAEQWHRIKPILDRDWPNQYTVISHQGGRVQGRWLPLGSTRDDYLDSVRLTGGTYTIELPEQIMTWLALLK